MITNRLRISLGRLLLKTAHLISRDCFCFFSLLLENRQMSACEIEILERVFTSGFFSNDVISAACREARCSGITSIIEFTFLLDQLNCSLEPDQS